MTSYERVTTVLSGRIPDRVPVCLLNYMCACKEAGLTLKECFKDAKKFATSQLRAQKKYKHDMLHLQNGIVGLAQSFGCEIEFYTSTCPTIVTHPFTDYENFINAHSRLAFGELCNVLLESSAIMIKELGDSVCIRPEVGQGPFSLAGLIFGLDKFLIDSIDEGMTEVINEVLHILMNAVIEFAKELKNIGVHIMGIGDSLISPDVVSPRIYEKFGYPYHKTMVDEFSKLGITLIIHICGNATPIIPNLVTSGVSAIELDHKIDSKLIKEYNDGKCTVIGNLDPSGVICHGNPQLVSLKSKEAIDLFGKNGFFILGSGCDIPFETPEENLYALVNTALNYGIYK
jgi:uroporphyrinogen decarboxylase